jgi:hypothetical protein
MLVIMKQLINGIHSYNFILFMVLSNINCCYISYDKNIA